MTATLITPDAPVDAQPGSNADACDSSITRDADGWPIVSMPEIHPFRPMSDAEAAELKQRALAGEIRPLTKRRLAARRLGHMVTGALRLVPAAGRALGRAGNWAIKHRAGLSCAIGAAALFVAAQSTQSGIGGLHLYDTFNETARTLMGLSGAGQPLAEASADGALLGAGVAAAIGVVAVGAGLLTRFSTRERADEPTASFLVRWEEEDEALRKEADLWRLIRGPAQPTTYYANNYTYAPKHRPVTAMPAYPIFDSAMATV